MSTPPVSMEWVEIHENFSPADPKRYEACAGFVEDGILFRAGSPEVHLTPADLGKTRLYVRRPFTREMEHMMDGSGFTWEKGTMYAARAYLQSDGKTVQVFQLKKDEDTPAYRRDDMACKTADLSDAQGIGRLVQAAISGELHSAK